MKNKKRILHVLFSDFGQEGTVGFRSYQIKNNSSNKISVICRKNQSKLKENIFHPFKGFLFLSLAGKVLRKYNIDYFRIEKFSKTIFNIYAKIHIKKHDLIHFFIHSEELIEYAKKLNKKVLIEAYTPPEYLQKLHENGIRLENSKHIVNKSQTNSYKYSDLIISPSHWVTERMKEIKIKTNKITYIPYGTKKNNFERDYRIDKIRFMFAGALKITKGVGQLLDAWETFEGYSNIELHLYGRKFPKLEKRITTMNNSYANFYYHDFTKKIKRAYTKNNIYVFPSYYEGSTKTIFEALSYGMPVITTKNSGSIVEHKTHGMIIKFSDKDSIVDAINYYIENPKKIELHGKMGREEVKEYTWEKYHSNVNNLYKKNNFS